MKTLITTILLLLSLNVGAGQVPDWMQTTANGDYDCSKKYCKNMISCSEAYHKMKTCNLKGLDRDKDGIPCENVCGKTSATMHKLLKQGR